MGSETKKVRQDEIDAVTTPAPGRKKLVAQQIARRDEMIIEDRIRGRTEELIAETYKITTRQVRNIVRAHREHGPQPLLKGKPPIEIVWEVVERQEAWIRQLAEIAVTADNDAAKVSAINGQAHIQDKLVELLQRTGVLPRNLGELRIQADIKFVAMRLVQVLKDENVPDATVHKLLAALGEASDGGQG